MSSGIPQMGEKDLQPSEAKAKGWSPRKELFDFLAWGRTQLGNSEMSYFPKDASTEPRQIMADNWVSPPS